MASTESPSRPAPSALADADGDGRKVSSQRGKTSATSFTDDRHVPLPYLRRPSTSFRGSFRTDSSSRPSLGPAASTDSLLLPRATADNEEHEEPTLWYSAPLLFAVLPAIVGVLFKSGSLFMTDLALLILTALYLNWCLVTPWIWYHSAQSLKVAEAPPSDTGILDSAVEDHLDGEEENSQDETPDTNATPKPDRGREAKGALRELRIHEITALALCFLGPLLGSYILHIVRSQLSTIGDQLVSNLHLTLFVLGAEVRPLRYAIKMAQARTIFLQRVVREDPHISQREEGPTELQDIRQRMDDVENALAERLVDPAKSAGKKPERESTEALRKVQSGMQSQIDALNRAVRRYEKRATAQTMQTEARLRDLDSRLREAVSLAAAAATYSQKPGIVAGTFLWGTSVVSKPLGAIYTAGTYPLRLMRDTIISLALRVGIVQVSHPRRRSARR